eukprot:TRINITY_DN70541_c0_g1_i1.p2 TRINITY_DN70541_c0_g1~~TRINITY_DN70541_c0_g1_i1.p2  ORF type:complete len:283 (+),score=104.90 TRINITY_DN70541_c0_g1_i1:78-851(+)
MRTAALLLLGAAACFAGSDDCPYSDETSCDAQSKCVWCKCSALPSSCWNCDDAQKLVPSVNSCDKGVVPGSSNGTCGKSLRVSSGGCNYDGAKALSWLGAMGCKDNVINDCPGGITHAQGCTDAEFFARALAAGGAVNLTAGTVTDAGSPKAAYENYQFQGQKYDLCTYDGLIAFLTAAGFQKSASASLGALPPGAVAWFDECPVGGQPTGKCRNPSVALGGGKFRFYNPLPGLDANCAVSSDKFIGAFPLYLTFTC